VFLKFRNLNARRGRPFSETRCRVVSKRRGCTRLALVKAPRTATGGAPAPATEKSTTSARHRPIPHSIGRILSSSTSPTSPCHHFGSGSAHRASGSAAVTIVVAKPSSRWPCFSVPLPPLLSGALCPPRCADARGVGRLESWRR
jgi:hypothetical protein